MLSYEKNYNALKLINSDFFSNVTIYGLFKNCDHNTKLNSRPRE